ncbi:MAG: hypothetical protein M1402_04130, partial [Candidatus Thermoplasmatota archaeon]|nr:hypothetical protein [Candidatus Thermoplasmatota archaeon]
HETGDNNRAISYYSNAINMNRSSWELFNNRGIAYLALGETWKAIRDFDMAINIDADQVLPIVQRAKAFLLAGMKERAMEDLLMAQKIDPSYSKNIQFPFDFESPEIVDTKKQ